MQISVATLKKLQACEPAIKMFKKHLAEKNLKSISLEKLIEEIINKNNYFNWGSWLLTHLMTREENIAYAIFAAKEVLPIFEARYPQDERPRKAIEAAEQYLTNKTSDAAAAYVVVNYVAVNYAYAAYYAAYDSYAAAHSAHAAYDSYAAASAASAAAHAAAHAASASYADAYTAASAASASTNDDANKSKILLYGLSIIQRRKTIKEDKS